MNSVEFCAFCCFICVWWGRWYNISAHNQFSVWFMNTFIFFPWISRGECCDRARQMCLWQNNNNNNSSYLWNNYNVPDTILSVCFYWPTYSSNYLWVEITIIITRSKNMHQGVLSRQYTQTGWGLNYHAQESSKVSLVTIGIHWDFFFFFSR